MNILYDGYVYRMQAVGGISRYLANLVDRLPENWSPVLTIGDLKPHEYSRLRIPTHKNLAVHHFPPRRWRPKLFYNWMSKRHFSKLESTGKFNLFHSVHHLSLASSCQTRRRRPFVLTVHDLIADIFNQELDPKGRDRTAIRRAVAAADAVICVSQNTRQDLLERIKVSEDRVFVTPLASELSSQMAFGDEPVPDRPYFLYVGAHQSPHKNFIRLLQAFARVVEKWPDLNLYVVGPELNALEHQWLVGLKLEERVKCIRDATDAHLAKLYRCSAALVYPSLYEGFGIPPLEAMACGTPVVVTNTSSLPEVVGDSAIQISPHSVESMAAGMSQILNMTAGYRRAMITKGLAQAARFDWDKTAAATIKVYKTLAV